MIFLLKPVPTPNTTPAPVNKGTANELTYVRVFIYCIGVLVPIVWIKKISKEVSTVKIIYNFRYLLS